MKILHFRRPSGPELSVENLSCLIAFILGQNILQVSKIAWLLWKMEFGLFWMWLFATNSCEKLQSKNKLRWSNGTSSSWALCGDRKCSGAVPGPVASTCPANDQPDSGHFHPEPACPGCPRRLMCPPKTKRCIKYKRSHGYRRFHSVLQCSSTRLITNDKHVGAAKQIIN